MNALNTYYKITKLLILATALIFNIDIPSAQNIVPPGVFEIPHIRVISTRNVAALFQQTITATQTQSINFGTYCVNGNTGGTITIGWDGSRTSTGNIVLLNIAPMAQPAIFELRVSAGRTVSFTYPPTGTLTGSGGGLLVFDIGPTEHGINGSTFTVNSDPNFLIPFKVGGTLHIPAYAIQGIYSGNFDISFNAE